MEKSARTSPNNVRNKRAMFEGNVSGESSPKATRTPRKDSCRDGPRSRNKSAPPVNRRRESDYNPVYNQGDILKEYGPSAVWLLTGGYKNTGKHETENNKNNGQNATEDNKNNGKNVAVEIKKVGKVTTEAFKSNATAAGGNLVSTELPNHKNWGRSINLSATQTVVNKNTSKFVDTVIPPPLPKSPPPSSPTFPNMSRPLNPPQLPPKLTELLSPTVPPTSVLPSSPSPPVSPVTLPTLSKTASLPFKLGSPEKIATERIERRSRAYRSSRDDSRNQQHIDDNDKNSTKEKQTVMQHLRNIFGEKVDKQSVQPVQPLKQRSKSMTRDIGTKQHAKTFATDLSKETYLFSKNPSGRNQIPKLEGSQKFEKIYTTQSLHTHETDPKSPQVHRSQIVIELDAHDKPREANKARKTSYPVKNKMKHQLDQCKENFTTTQPRNEARNVQERSIPITIQQSTRSDDKLQQFPLTDCTIQQSGLHTNRQSTAPFLKSNHHLPVHNHTVHQFLVDSTQQSAVDGHIGSKRSVMDHNKEMTLGTKEKTLSNTANKSQFQGKLIKTDKAPSECLIKCALCRNRQMS